MRTATTSNLQEHLKVFHLNAGLSLLELPANRPTSWRQGLTQKIMSILIKPFKIDVPPEEVDRLKRRLEDTRLPKYPIVPGAGDDYGPSMSWIHDMYSKFRSFDWDKAQKHLNRLSHHLASIPDPVSGHTLDIHFTNTPSSRENAIPIILVHGWPGSIHEFDRVVERLSEPSDPTQQAFHVVVPSIPGFLYSSPPPQRGWTMQDTARIFHLLMLALGHDKYVAQAGDWGMFVARELGANPEFNQHCRAVNLKFCPTPLPEGLTDADLSGREKKIEAQCQDWLDNHLGYAVMMRTRPHTLGVSLVDNPIGIMLWVGEKFLELATPAHLRDPAFRAEWDDATLTTVFLYHFSGCMMTSMLPYFENVKHAGFGEYVIAERNQIKVPLAFMSCAFDSRPGTKRGVERSGQLVYYKEYDECGHFAALECPELLASDLRMFCRQHFKA